MEFFVTSGGAGSDAGFGAGGPDASRGALAAQFLPVLRQLGRVRLAGSAAEGVRRARWAGGLHLCLALPHELPKGAGAETIPVFGLGVASCPDAPFAGVPQTDWRSRLARGGGAICLSTHAAHAVRALMGEIFPVVAALPPVGGPADPIPPAAVTLQADGYVLDTARWPDTGPPIRPGPLVDEADDAWPDPSIAVSTPAQALVWRKTPRYRLGVTRLHLSQMYREAVRDLLPAPMARLVAHTGHAGIRAARRALALRRRGRPTSPTSDGDADAEFIAWQAGAQEVALDGLVFAAVHGAWDRSWNDTLSAFVTTCRDDAAATLAIRTADLDDGSRAGLASHLRRLGPFACRVVIVDGTIEGGLAPLIAAAHFYVCASHAEPAPLPAMRFAASGRPLIAPAHSGLADFVDPATSFVVASGIEYDMFPGDPEERLLTNTWRLDWESLCTCIEAARALAHAPAAYAARSAAIARRMQEVCGGAAVLAALAPLLAKQAARTAVRVAA